MNLEYRQYILLYEQLSQKKIQKKKNTYSNIYFCSNRNVQINKLVEII